MGIINQQVCDGCGRILFGRNGTEVTRRSYVQFRGQITTHTVDEKTGWVDHVYLTPTNNNDLSFCAEAGNVKLDCVQAYVGQRTIIAKQKIEAAKRRAATEEQARDDGDESFDYSVGGKKYKMT